ncbi:MAG: ATP-binding protein [Thermoanaerobaculia bacterium]|nr:ATP-binding protein [Thermoanaerobaculia bacterium]
MAIPRLSLRHRWILYLVVIHLGLGGLVFWHLRDDPWWFLGLELALSVSLLTGVILARRLGLPRQLLQTGSELIREEQFGSRLSPEDEPEAAELVELFNRMMDRLRQERLRVQERERFLQEVIEASPAAFLTLDHDGRIDLANPASETLLERDEEELRGRALSAVEHPVARQLAALAVGETRLVNLQGRRLRAVRSQFFDRGFPRSFYLVEELTEELRDTERAAYDKLIRMISHEVKNSVGSVVSLLQSTESLASELGTERREKVSKALTVAEDRLRSLDRFVNGFAEVVRLPPPDRRPVALDRLLDDLLVLLEPELEANGVEVRWAVRPDSLPRISADKNQLEQALVNVLRNSLEAMDPGGGEIELALETRDGTVQLAVADSGPGIPEDVREQLFVPFVSTKRDGRGLGLTLIREILEGHGFSYSLENRSEEAGALFRLSVPSDFLVEAGGESREGR